MGVLLRNIERDGDTERERGGEGDGGMREGEYSLLNTK